MGVSKDSPIHALCVSDVMTRDVVAVAPETSLVTVARLLSEHHISGAPVVDGSGRAVGVISASDLVNPDRVGSQTRGVPVFYRIEHGWASPEIDTAAISAGRAEDVMTPMPFTIDGRAAVLEAAATMVEQRVHRLLVTEEGALAGIVSTIDLLRGIAQCFAED